MKASVAPSPLRRRGVPVAAVIATASLALLVAACGGSASATGSGGASNAGGSPSSLSAVGYSHCMRSHGVPNFPDPDSSGQLPKGDAQHLGSAAPSCRRPGKHVSSCSRTTAGRSTPTRSNNA